MRGGGDGAAMRAGGLVFAALLLAGCPGPQHARPDDFSADPAPLLAAVERRASAIKSLTGELSIEAWRGDERIRLKQLVAVDSTGRVRIDALSPFGQPLSTLVSDGSRLMIYDLEKKTFRIGAATPENMARLLPIELEPDALSALLRGSVPLIAHDRATVSWNADEGSYRLELEAGSRRQRIEFEPAALRVVRLWMWDAGGLRYRARFGDYTGEGDAVIPQRMRFEAPDDDVRIDLRVVDHALDPELPAAAFELEAPRGVRVEAL